MTSSTLFIKRKKPLLQALSTFKDTCISLDENLCQRSIDFSQLLISLLPMEPLDRTSLTALKKRLDDLEHSHVLMEQNLNKGSAAISKIMLVLSEMEAQSETSSSSSQGSTPDTQPWPPGSELYSLLTTDPLPDEPPPKRTASFYTASQVLENPLWLTNSGPTHTESLVASGGQITKDKGRSYLTTSQAQISAAPSLNEWQTYSHLK